MVKVTVYVLNHNYGRYLSQAVESVLSQTYQNLEIILIDDGSTDDSREVIDQYSDKAIIIYQENLGLTKSIQKAFSMATGEYVVRLDADDWMDTRCIEELVKTIESSTDIALVFPDYYEVDEFGQIIRRIKRHDFSKNVTMYDQPAHGACTLIRKTHYFDIGGHDDNYQCQDGVDIWLSLTAKYDVLNVTKPLFYYRKHAQSLTTNEGKILSTRAQIFRDHAAKRGFVPQETHAFLLVRSQKINDREYALTRIGEKSVIEWVAGKAKQSALVTKLVVLVDDQQLQRDIEEIFYNDFNVLVASRDKKHASSSVSISDSVKHYLNSSDNVSPETIVVLTLNYPFSRHNYIDSAIYSMFLFNSNSIDSVVMDNSIFYFHDGNGLRPWSDIYVRNERDDIYLRRGGISVFKRQLVEDENSVISEKMGHVIIDQISSFEIRNHEDIKIADYIAQNLL